MRAEKTSENCFYQALCSAVQKSGIHMVDYCCTESLMVDKVMPGLPLVVVTLNTIKMGNHFNASAMKWLWAFSVNLVHFSVREFIYLSEQTIIGAFMSCGHISSHFYFCCTLHFKFEGKKLNLD